MMKKNTLPQKAGVFSTFCFFAVTVIWAVLGGGCSQRVEFPEEIANQLPEKIDFNLHIKPLLSDRCFACHGPDKNNQKAGLQLDTPEGAFAAMGDEKDHFPIIPGNPHESEVFKRMFTDDPETVMPPPESNLKLTEYEKALITRWIEEGAQYKPHWSYIQPEKPKAPTTNNTDWAKNDIDAFILNKLEREGLSPSEQADKETLIRRVSFDLTGLPPTPQEIDDFLVDTSPNAFEKVVDRLLASPHYGERLATEWMDVARYADSHGYQDDGMRNMWPWRNWVIEKFNDNLPFNDFVTWQLAGDLMPNPTKEQILATGFNRNHMQSQEGGIVSEEYRVEYVADRTMTFGKAFLGLTVECARCHDHKYDPISQKEYFQLFAFFNNVQETGQIPYMGEASPTVFLTDAATDSILAFLEEKIVPLEKEMAASNPALQKRFDTWLPLASNNVDALPLTTGLLGHYPLETGTGKENRTLENLAKADKTAKLKGAVEDLPQPAQAKFGEGYQFTGDSHIDLGKEIGYFEKNEPFTISLWVKLLNNDVHGPIFSRSGGLFNGNRGYDLMIEKDGTLSASLNHTFPANSIAVTSLDTLPVGEWLHLAMTWDGSGKAKGLKIFKNGTSLSLDVEADNLKASILHFGKNKANWGGLGNLRIGRRFDETVEDLVVDELMVFERDLAHLEVYHLFGKEEGHVPPFNLPSLLAKEMDALSQQEKALLLELYAKNYDEPLKITRDELIKLRGEETALYTEQPEMMVMKELKEPRQTYMLDRGVYDAPTDSVFPNTIARILPFSEELPKNRLGLAKWLLDEQNPLFARVMVNRYWQMVFGQGLVASSDDFGNQGDLPTHPQLLDWLAISFRDSGYDLKALLKTMVMTATYQQSSTTTEELLEIDPANQLLARAPAYRMSAEMVRDNVLAASGLLVKEIGGPSVKPYQPPGLWKQLATRNATRYVQQHGDSLYRRSMYTIWKRTSPPPSMISFDSPERNFCTVKRQKTSTPLQALVLLNDPQFIEAARLVAERMLREGGESLDDQIVYGFRLLTSRFPDEKEMNLLKQLYQEEKDAFIAGENSADALLSVGEFERNMELVPNEHAALAMVATTLINFDETVFKR